MDADKATRVAFEALKPICLQVMGLLKGGPNASGGRALEALADLIPKLPAVGLPRCIDYVLIPLSMLATACSSNRVAGSDRLLELALRCTDTLITSAGPFAFLADSVRFTDASQLALGLIAESAAQTGGPGSGSSPPAVPRVSDDTLKAALALLANLCEQASGVRLLPHVAATCEHGDGSAHMREARRRADDLGLLASVLHVTSRGTSTVPPPFSSPAVSAHALACLLHIATSASASNSSVANGSKPGFNAPVGMLSKPADIYSSAARAVALRAFIALVSTLSRPDASAVDGSLESSTADARAAPPLGDSRIPEHDETAPVGPALLAPFVPGCAAALGQLLLLAPPGALNRGLLRDVARSALVSLCTLLRLTVGGSAAREPSQEWWAEARVRLALLVTQIFAKMVPALCDSASSAGGREFDEIRVALLSLANTVKDLCCADAGASPNAQLGSVAYSIAWDASLLLGPTARTFEDSSDVRAFLAARAAQLLVSLPTLLHRVPESGIVSASEEARADASEEARADASEEARADAAKAAVVGVVTTASAAVTDRAKGTALPSSATESLSLISDLPFGGVVRLFCSYLQRLPLSGRLAVLQAGAAVWEQHVAVLFQAAARPVYGSPESRDAWVRQLSRLLIAAISQPGQPLPQPPTRATGCVDDPSRWAASLWSGEQMSPSVCAALVRLVDVIVESLGHRAASLVMELLRVATGRVVSMQPSSSASDLHSAVLEHGLPAYPASVDSAAVNCLLASDLGFCFPAQAISQLSSDANRLNPRSGSRDQRAHASDLLSFPAMVELPLTNTLSVDQRSVPRTTHPALQTAAAYANGAAVASESLITQVQSLASSLLAGGAVGDMYEPVAASLVLRNPSPSAPHVLWLTATLVRSLGKLLRTAALRVEVETNDFSSSSSELGAALASVATATLRVMMPMPEDAAREAVATADCFLARLQRPAAVVGNLAPCSVSLSDAAWACGQLRSPCFLALALRPAVVCAELDGGSLELVKAAASLAAGTVLCRNLRCSIVDAAPESISHEKASENQSRLSALAVESVLPGLIAWRAHVVVQSCGLVSALAGACGGAMKSFAASLLPQLTTYALEPSFAEPPSISPESSQVASADAVLRLTMCTESALGSSRSAALDALQCLSLPLSVSQPFATDLSLHIPLPRPLSVEKSHGDDNDSGVVRHSRQLVSAGVSLSPLASLMYNEAGALADDALHRLASSAAAVTRTLASGPWSLSETAALVAGVAHSVGIAGEGRRARALAVILAEVIPANQDTLHAALISPGTSSSASDLAILQDLAAGIRSANVAISRATASSHGVLEEHFLRFDASCASLCLVTTAAHIASALVSCGQPADRLWLAAPVALLRDRREVSADPATWRPVLADRMPSDESGLNEGSGVSPSRGATSSSDTTQDSRVPLCSSTITQLSAVLRRAVARCKDVAMMRQSQINQRAPQSVTLSIERAARACNNSATLASLPLSRVLKRPAEHASPGGALAPPHPSPTSPDPTCDLIAKAIGAALPLLLPAAQTQLVDLANSTCRQHIGASASLLRSVDGTGRPAISSYEAVHQLQCTATSLGILMTVATGLARHPAALLPLLNDLWPSLATLLPPADLTISEDGASFVAAAHSRGSASLPTAAHSIRGVMWPHEADCRIPGQTSLSGATKLYTTAPVTSSGEGCGGGAGRAWGDRDLPPTVTEAAAAAAGVGGAASDAARQRAVLLEATRSFMSERAQALTASAGKRDASAVVACSGGAGDTAPRSRSDPSYRNGLPNGVVPAQQGSQQRELRAFRRAASALSQTAVSPTFMLGTLGDPRRLQHLDPPSSLRAIPGLHSARYFPNTTLADIDRGPTSALPVHLLALHLAALQVR